ncbi:DUF4181 domain-containing protein [Bacillus sp. BHET2]|uniref:DUF4181 domain-containing protein n=1 Tax=Bacillus sp. BHET2 TaxID=2583818 RepID=UPI00110EC0DD|nr:DUF4181 domain-containing protein [Bacillus sp. BHET2]TMU87240.1 DUF4181 domain-containing protein [Bacillus sp. BHET2]
MGFAQYFFIKLLFVMVMYFLFIYLFHHLISRWLDVEKRKIFSHELINAQHEKGDKVIRSLAAVTYIVGFIIIIVTDFEPDSWYFQLYGIMAFFFVVGQLWKAFMEKKNIDDIREFTYTMMETGFHIFLFIAIFSTVNWLY